MSGLIRMRVHANGDAPTTFMNEGRAIYNAAVELEDEVNANRSVFDGRNYQHLNPEDARRCKALDDACLIDLMAAVERLKLMAIAIYNVGDSA